MNDLEYIIKYGERRVYRWKIVCNFAFNGNFTFKCAPVIFALKTIFLFFFHYVGLLFNDKENVFLFHLKRTKCIKTSTKTKINYKQPVKPNPRSARCDVTHRVSPAFFMKAFNIELSTAFIPLDVFFSSRVPLGCVLSFL